MTTKKRTPSSPSEKTKRPAASRRNAVVYSSKRALKFDQLKRDRFFAQALYSSRRLLEVVSRGRDLPKFFTTKGVRVVYHGLEGPRVMVEDQHFTVTINGILMDRAKEPEVATAEEKRALRELAEFVEVKTVPLPCLPCNVVYAYYFRVRIGGVEKKLCYIGMGGTGGVRRLTSHAHDDTTEGAKEILSVFGALERVRLNESDVELEATAFVLGTFKLVTAAAAFEKKNIGKLILAQEKDSLLIPFNIAEGGRTGISQEEVDAKMEEFVAKYLLNVNDLYSP